MAQNDTAVGTMREALANLVSAGRSWLAALNMRRTHHDLKGDLQIQERNAAQDVEDALHVVIAHKEQQHLDDIAVDGTAEAMKQRLAEKRAEGRGGWHDPEESTVEYIAALLVGAVVKGKPIDVANFAMMLHQRGAAPHVLTQALITHCYAAGLPLADPGWNTEEVEAWSTDDEEFRHHSLEELLEENDLLKVGDTVYLGQATYPDPAAFFDADDVLEMVGDRGADEGGEFADGYPDDLDEEATSQLDRFLQAWLRTHCAPRFFTVTNSRPYVLTAADFPSDHPAGGTHA
ncbi:hypothetical protein ACKI2N_001830 [Cupriavidus sp. 30B13]|uniref:hypothetical protein n=1 Tax=Cupriavidus sp. 30B13 TaxID=3384241 RepID=UPI003B8F8277